MTEPDAEEFNEDTMWEWGETPDGRPISEDVPHWERKGTT